MPVWVTGWPKVHIYSNVGHGCQNQSEATGRWTVAVAGQSVCSTIAREYYSMARCTQTTEKPVLSEEKIGGNYNEKGQVIHPHPQCNVSLDVSYALDEVHLVPIKYTKMWHTRRQRV